MKKALEAASFVTVVEAVGFAGAALGGLVGSNPWFDDLPKPRGWPPRWVFPIAWSAMSYPSLGLATWSIWRKRSETDVSPQLATFAALVAHNVLFGAVVNRAKRTDVYVIMDTIGVANAAALVVNYGRIDRRAGALLMPLLTWAVYTTAIKVQLHRYQSGRL